ncbi:uncharacterized protein BDFB_004408, partial [Asbolus verrucosus]
DKEKQVTSEERWILKLKCLEDAHSKQNGLTQEGFDDLMARLEKRLKSAKIPVNCEKRDRLIECLSKNPTCMLNCKREMDDFIDCVDTIRIRRIKERIQESIKPMKKHDSNAMFT